MEPAHLLSAFTPAPTHRDPQTMTTAELEKRIDNLHDEATELADLSHRASLAASNAYLVRARDLLTEAARLRAEIEEEQ